MEMQSQASVTNSQPQPLETSQAAAAPSPAPGNHLTEAASISPVPMGTWLAFHDQDVPTLARLAMYDPAEDAFMLGNNHGILVRRINTSELSRLIDSEMVQLVEFRSINQ